MISTLIVCYEVFWIRSCFCYCCVAFFYSIYHGTAFTSVSAILNLVKPFSETEEEGTKVVGLCRTKIISVMRAGLK